VSSILDNAMRHFSESADTELHELAVTEWGESVWFKSVSSMNGLQYQKFVAAAQKSDFEGLVDIFLLRARKEDGTRMFNTGDKKALMNSVSPDMITGIVNRMSAIDNQDAEAVKKS
jgi:hypothetical protein